jgi:hypothetical protein
MVMNFDKKVEPQILYMMYIVIQPQSYHTTHQISIAYCVSPGHLYQPIVDYKPT